MQHWSALMSWCPQPHEDVPWPHCARVGQWWVNVFLSTPVARHLLQHRLAPSGGLTQTQTHARAQSPHTFLRHLLLARRDQAGRFGKYSTCYFRWTHAFQRCACVCGCLCARVCVSVFAHIQVAAVKMKWNAARDLQPPPLSFIKKRRLSGPLWQQQWDSSLFLSVLPYSELQLQPDRKSANTLNLLWPAGWIRCSLLFFLLF